MSSRFAMGGEHAISVDFQTTDYAYRLGRRAIEATNLKGQEFLDNTEVQTALKRTRFTNAEWFATRKLRPDCPSILIPTSRNI